MPEVVIVGLLLEVKFLVVLRGDVCFLVMNLLLLLRLRSSLLLLPRKKKPASSSAIVVAVVAFMISWPPPDIKASAASSQSSFMAFVLLSPSDTSSSAEISASALSEVGPIISFLFIFLSSSLPWLAVHHCALLQFITALRQSRRSVSEKRTRAAYDDDRFDDPAAMTATQPEAGHNREADLGSHTVIVVTHPNVPGSTVHESWVEQSSSASLEDGSRRLHGKGEAMNQPDGLCEAEETVIEAGPRVPTGEYYVPVLRGSAEEGLLHSFVDDLEVLPVAELSEQAVGGDAEKLCWVDAAHVPELSQALRSVLCWVQNRREAAVDVEVLVLEAAESSSCSVGLEGEASVSRASVPDRRLDRLGSGFQVPTSASHQADEQLDEAQLGFSGAPNRRLEELHCGW